MTEEVRRAAEILRRGGLVAFPTETVYGLGADASNPSAVKKLYAVKGRPTDHPVTAGDLMATIYERLGVDPETTVPDQTGRPTHISHGGRPVRGVLA